ncbi:uncharacterized protein LOC141537557 [Cotesia typhae]|uniref:uncharacterized protein LOC141537557 n=1 Tax=Cotesia typhae TaxID=2053667 RepID=UPI003D69E37F
MDYVIDFTGFYYFNQFVIEEFCECRVSQKGVKVEDAKIFAIDPTNISSYGITQSGLNDYYYTFGIGVKYSRCLLSELVEYISQLLSSKKTIYLRDNDKFNQLKQFMKIPHNYDNVVRLEDKGFNSLCVVLGTDCPYHDNPNDNYCVRNNAKLMANWLKDMKFPECVAVVDFSGYRSVNGDFRIKELCMSLMNKSGAIIDKVSLVTVALQALDFLEDVQAYNVTYYDNYGIKWKTGNSPLQTLEGTVKKFLSNYDVTVLFVRNREIEMKLKSVIQDIVEFEILRLTDFGYADAVNIGIKLEVCKFHEHPDPRKNVCAVVNNVQMAQFVFDMQLFKIKVLEAIKNFKITSQKLIDVGNSGINHSNLGNLTSNQTHADSDDNNKQPESSSDDLDDLLKDFHVDNNTETSNDINVDILLESQDVLNDDFSVNNFDIDLLY